MTDLHFPTSKRTIMVVDDEPELAAIVRRMLERKGYSVRCAYSGPYLLAGLEGSIVWQGMSQLSS